jgi:hypothetical protein
MSLIESIREDRRWQGPRLAVACLGGLAVLGTIAIAIVIGPPPLSNALGSVTAALFGYGLIRYNREGVATYLSIWGLRGDGWFAGLVRATWVVGGLIVIGFAIHMASQAVREL